MSRILVKGGCVLSMSQKTGNHREADLLVENGVIAEIGPALRARDAEVVDAAGCIVMPGFVDTHRHVWESLFRGLDYPAAHDAPAQLGARYSGEDVYAATLLGLLSAVEAGITTLVDWFDVDSSHAEAALEAHAEAGLRTVFVLAAGADREDHRTRLKRLADSAVTPMTTLAAAPRVPLPNQLGEFAEDWSAARELGLRIHAHLGVAPAERGSAAELAARGLLGPDVTLVHCSSLEASDFDAIAAAGATVSIAPSSEMAKGFAAPPIQKLLDRGIRPGLAVDSERMAPGDIFAPMRAMISFQHATSFDLKLAGKGGAPQLLTTRQVIRSATADGARVAGLGDVTGSLEAGKQADIVVLRADRPNIAPVNDPIGAVVWGMDTSNVDWVLVAGRPLVRGGELQGDVARVRDLAVEARRRVAGTGSLAGSERTV